MNKNEWIDGWKLSNPGWLETQIHFKPLDGAKHRQYFLHSVSRLCLVFWHTLKSTHIPPWETDKPP